MTQLMRKNSSIIAYFCFIARSNCAPSARAYTVITIFNFFLVCGIFLVFVSVRYFNNYYFLFNFLSIVYKRPFYYSLMYFHDR